MKLSESCNNVKWSAKRVNNLPLLAANRYNSNGTQELCHLTAFHVRLVVCGSDLPPHCICCGAVKMARANWHLEAIVQDFLFRHVSARVRH